MPAGPVPVPGYSASTVCLPLRSRSEKGSATTTARRSPERTATAAASAGAARARAVVAASAATVPLRAVTRGDSRRGARSARRLGYSGPVATPLEEIELVRADPQPTAAQEAVIHLGVRILTLDGQGGTVRRVEDGQVAEPEWYPRGADALEEPRICAESTATSRSCSASRPRPSTARTSIASPRCGPSDAEIPPRPRPGPSRRSIAARRGCRRFYTEMFAILGSGRYVIEEARADGEVVLMRTRQQTSGVASGIPIENRFVNLLWLSGGLSRRLEFYRDEEEGEKAFAALAG